MKMSEQMIGAAQAMKQNRITVDWEGIAIAAYQEGSQGIQNAEQQAQGFSEQIAEMEKSHMVKVKQLSAEIVKLQENLVKATKNVS